MQFDYSLARTVRYNKGCVYENRCHYPGSWFETVWYSSKKPTFQREESRPTFLLYSQTDRNISCLIFLTNTLKGGEKVVSNQINPTNVIAS